jgi:hypothetical protein
MELLGAVFHEVENGLLCDLVGSSEIFVEGRGADPSEGAESELEDVAHDVLYVTGVTEKRAVQSGPLTHVRACKIVWCGENIWFCTISCILALTAIKL